MRGSPCGAVRGSAFPPLHRPSNTLAPAYVPSPGVTLSRGPCKPPPPPYPYSRTNQQATAFARVFQVLNANQLHTLRCRSNYIVEFPKGATPEDRRLLLGALMHVDYEVGLWVLLWARCVLWVSFLASSGSRPWVGSASHVCWAGAVVGSCKG